MAAGDMTSPFAPLDPFPERVTNVIEAKMAPNAPGGRGPDRFQEGIASDTDVPNDFMLGVRQGYETGARPNQNKNVFEKPPQETMQERAHVGSAAWVGSISLSRSSRLPLESLSVTSMSSVALSVTETTV